MMATHQYTGEQYEAGPQLASSRQQSHMVPGSTLPEGRRVVDTLQTRLTSLVELSSTLKHVHWNVVGANFIGVHLLDLQVAGTLAMVDDLGGRIVALGGVPSGLTGPFTKPRDWNDYSLNPADSLVHLGALDAVYSGVIGAHRFAVECIAEDDRVSADLLIGQVGVLEHHQWFVRSHLVDWVREMAHAESHSQTGAVQAFTAKKKVVSATDCEWFVAQVDDPLLDVVMSFPTGPAHHFEPPAVGRSHVAGTTRSSRLREHDMKTQRVQISAFPVTHEGTADLPDGAVIVAVDFEDEGGMGSDRRPATAWVAMSVENEPT